MDRSRRRVDKDDRYATPTSAEPSQRKWFRYTLPGAYGALIFGCLSFAPSLLPRGGLLQGALLGVNAAIGYGLGVCAAWIWRAFADRDARPTRRNSWRWFLGIAVVLLADLLHLRPPPAGETTRLDGSGGAELDSPTAVARHRGAALCWPGCPFASPSARVSRASAHFFIAGSGQRLRTRSVGQSSSVALISS